MSWFDLKSRFSYRRYNLQHHSDRLPTGSARICHFDTCSIATTDLFHWSQRFSLQLGSIRTCLIFLKIEIQVPNKLWRFILNVLYKFKKVTTRFRQKMCTTFWKYEWKDSSSEFGLHFDIGRIWENILSLEKKLSNLFLFYASSGRRGLWSCWKGDTLD